MIESLTIIELIKHLAYGMFLGAVIGIDREKVSILSNTHKFAGLRTFTLIGMLGVLLSLLQSISIIFFAIVLAGFLLLVISSYITHTLKYNTNGGTSEIASIIVLIAGYFVGIDNYTLATIITIFTALLLYGKKPLRDFASKITQPELKSVIQFIVIAFIVLPLLPNQSFGPLDAFNPYVIWTMIVVISGLSFLSYIGIKLIGTERGLSLSGFLGGLVSSTAVTLTFSKNSKKYSGIVYPFVFGIIIAATAMFFRILLAVFIVNPALTESVAIPLLSSGFTGLLVSAFLWKKQKNEHANNKAVNKSQSMEFNNPLDLIGAIKFGVIFALILLIAKFMSITFGDGGIYLTSILSGLVDTDAITVSLANLVKSDSISIVLATIGITLATMTNTLIKGVYVLALASRPVAIRTIFAVLIIVIAGCSSLFFI